MIIDHIKEKIKELQTSIDEIHKMYEEGYDPDDWSGGNFDDCYDLGSTHGKHFGEMDAYKEILSLLEK